ncbi:MAG: capsular biosynthesis protein [Bacteroidetes bacterium 4572_77]|nr:MAG: capsular biosynthesis protein [Bacteroidetes bacterium 4572_77]
MIPFSPPHIKQEAIDEVVDTLKSGWITTGPKTKRFEQEISKYCGAHKTLCVSSATFGLEIILRWFGVGPDDEVIIPAYTYTASANTVAHTGAKIVMVDANADDFNINLAKIAAAITPKTKAIIPVDIAGLPVDTQELLSLVTSVQIKKQFVAANELQEKLGRILVLSDAAHSLGASLHDKKVGSWADITVFSFHAVKNLTTAEGGAIAFHLPAIFDVEAIYKEINTISLHGQSKDALAKAQIGAWQYDVLEAGYKGNMTDIQASLGLVALKYYEIDNLPYRKQIMTRYQQAFEKYDWAELPILKEENRETSYHVYTLRIKNISEKTRNLIIDHIFKKEVSVNVHFQPLPLFTAYKNKGFKMEDYPVAFDNYSREISLPVYQDLQEAQIEQIISAVIQSVKEVL